MIAPLHSLAFIALFGLPAALAIRLVMIGQLLDAGLQPVERHAVAGQHHHVVGQRGGEARQRGEIFPERVLVGLATI